MGWPEKGTWEQTVIIAQRHIAMSWVWRCSGPLGIRDCVWINMIQHHTLGLNT